MTEINEFPDCCAVNIISGFEDCEFPIHKMNIDNLEDLENVLLELDSAITDRSRTITLAITHDTGQKVVASILKEFGFKVLKKFKNRATKSPLTMWEFLFTRQSVGNTHKIKQKYFDAIEERKEKLDKSNGDF